MAITLLEAFRKKYPGYADKVAERFQLATGCEFSWNNMTKPNLADYVAFLRQKLAGSTVRTSCAQLKSVLGLYEEEYPLPKNWRDALYQKKDSSQQVYLTEDEVSLIVNNFTPTTENEYIVYSRFLLGCLTGARHSDFIKFSKGNIREDGMLCYVSVKTHIEANVPVAPIVPELIEMASQYKEKEIADTTFNRILRKICADVDIDSELTLYRRGTFTTSPKCDFISSHTARRTFATNLYLRGADLYSISKMMGHSSVDMTSGYICCGLRNLSPEIKGYFEQFA